MHILSRHTCSTISCKNCVQVNCKSICMILTRPNVTLYIMLCDRSNKRRIDDITQLVHILWYLTATLISQKYDTFYNISFMNYYVSSVQVSNKSSRILKYSCKCPTNRMTKKKFSVHVMSSWILITFYFEIVFWICQSRSYLYQIMTKNYGHWKLNIMSSYKQTYHAVYIFVWSIKLCMFKKR